MCDLNHRKLMHAGREEESENSFTEILFPAFSQGRRRGMQWNEFLLLCPHLFKEHYSSARRGGEIIFLTLT